MVLVIRLGKPSVILTVGIDTGVNAPSANKSLVKLAIAERVAVPTP